MIDAINAGSVRAAIRNQYSLGAVPTLYGEPIPRTWGEDRKLDDVVAVAIEPPGDIRLFRVYERHTPVPVVSRGDR